MPTKCKDCQRTAYYNVAGEKAIYCFEHCSSNMIDVTNRRCAGNDCKKYPAFNYPGEKKCKYCHVHSLDGMVNLKHRSCKHPGCKIRSIFNFNGEHKPLFCVTHKLEGMIDIKSKLCKSHGCFTQPSFNYPGKQGVIWCSRHKLPGMIDNKSKKCKLCDKSPNFNIPGETVGAFCLNHKENGMEDVTHKRCKTFMCNTHIKNKYEGYCLFCFINTFPEKPVSRNYKTREQSVVDFVLKSFSDFTWVTDKIISDGCSRRRPDLLVDLGHQIIIIEIDENQHNNYSCENKRTMEISQDLGFRPIIFIRFNPDSYFDQQGRQVPSCWGLNKNGIIVIKNKQDYENRLTTLKQQIQFWYKTISNKTITTVELFYNST